MKTNLIIFYTKFDILDIKLNDFHIEFEDMNKMIDIIISDEYTKIYRTYYPIKNYDLVQDKFFIYSGYINTPLKKIVILFLNIVLKVNILIFH